MYIQEIILDGFKSYAQKTVISGFDQQFNAITGLNGTGKSNILDSICFVLGISNLSQVSCSKHHMICCRDCCLLFLGSCWKLARIGLQAGSGWDYKSDCDYYFQ
jgi:hypothetical protein